MTVELWRTEFRVRAYRDQTGAWRDGYVVFEQVEATDTGERFDVDDGYSVHKAYGRIYVTDDGRRFKVWGETVDYSGGTHVVPEQKPNISQGHWQMEPRVAARYVRMDGSSVVKKGAQVVGN